MANWIVAKFGGTSMGTIESMSRCADIVEDKQANIVVVSATSGTTNQLVELTELAMSGHKNKAARLLDTIRDRHLNMLRELNFDTEVLKGHEDRLKEIMKKGSTLVKGCCYLQECSPRAYDGIVAMGELLSSFIFSLVLTKSNRPVQWFDSRKIITTDDHYTKALPCIEKIEKNCLDTFLDTSTIYIGQGFIGSTPEGATTTLGRGGSDYSAALIAEGLNADILQIWTDVPGMASTDPRLCPDARSIEKISFKEAAEMATFGAKILHPATLTPAIRKEIPVFVGSTFAPNEPGTIITREVDHKPIVRAVTIRRNQALLTFSNPRMLNASGFLRKIFEIFDLHEVSVDAVTTSEISVAVTIDRKDLPHSESENHFVNDLKQLGKVAIEDNLSLVAIIGNNIPSTAGLGEDIFRSLDDINVRMITQGASNHNFCILVNDADADNAVKRLHNYFIYEQEQTMQEQ